MKKILLATTMLAGFAGAASADITFSGYGRFGLEYNSEPNKIYFADGRTAANTDELNLNGTPAQHSSSVIAGRMRVNIDGKTVTDDGITFGGRIRIQSDVNSGGAYMNAPQLYAVSQGFRVEAGNANEALDSVALFYNSEMGFEDSSAGEAGNFFSYSSGPYSTKRAGVFFSYAMDALNLRVSYITPNQYRTNQLSVIEPVSGRQIGVEGEFSASADYTWNGFTFAAGGAAHAGGISTAFYNFVGAAYAITPDINVGLNYNNANYLALAGYAGSNAPGFNTGRNLFSSAVSITTLYGNYTMGAITLKGYIAGTNADYAKNSTILGIGADYALGGGAVISGSIRPNYAGTTNADLGVKFNF